MADKKIHIHLVLSPKLIIGNCPAERDPALLEKLAIDNAHVIGIIETTQAASQFGWPSVENTLV